MLAGGPLRFHRRIKTEQDRSSSKTDPSEFTSTRNHQLQVVRGGLVPRRIFPDPGTRPPGTTGIRSTSRAYVVGIEKPTHAKKESHKRRRNSIPSVARPKSNNPRSTHPKRERTVFWVLGSAVLYDIDISTTLAARSKRLPKRRRTHLSLR